MSWDPVWEEIFANRPWGKYPPEPLIRFMAANYREINDKSKIKVLEVGCGPGSGPAWFLAREGYDYHGIDGSKTAIELGRRRFAHENISGHFEQGEITQLPWKDAAFDCVIDVGCLACNTESDSKKAIAEIFRVLKPGGKHFSYTVSAGTWGDGLGQRLDATTFYQVPEGPLAQMGPVRFASRESLKSLYQEFSEVKFGRSTYQAGDWKEELIIWIVTAEKRGDKHLV